MVEKYGGDPTPIVTPPFAFPAPNVSREERATLVLVSHCCINETIANAWLESCYAMATDRDARAAIRELLADEIDHARIGWAHLASASAEMRRSVQRFLPSLVRSNFSQWSRPDPNVPEPGIKDHGVPGPAENREIVRQALSDLVLSGFDYLGFDTRRARAAF